MEGPDHVLQEEEKGGASYSKITAHFELVKDYIDDLKKRGGPFYAVPCDKRGFEDRSMKQENAIFRCTRCQKIPLEAMKCNGCSKTVCKNQCYYYDSCRSSLCTNSTKRELTQDEKMTLEKVDVGGCRVLNCTEEKKKFTYQQYIEHLTTTCRYLRQMCPLGCGFFASKDTFYAVHLGKINQGQSGCHEVCQKHES